MKCPIPYMLLCGLVFLSPVSTKADIIEVDRNRVIEALAGCPMAPIREYVRGLNGTQSRCVMLALESIGCTEQSGPYYFKPSMGRALPCFRVANGLYDSVERQMANTEDIEILFSGYLAEAPADLPILGMVMEGEVFDPKPYIRHNALSLLGCSNRPNDGTTLPEEEVCFQEMFGLSGSSLSPDETRALEYAGANLTRHEAIVSLRRHGIREPVIQTPRPVSVARQQRPPTPSLSTEPRPIGGAFALGSPTDEDMRQAMERHFMVSNAALGALQQSCDDFRRNENPFSALGCLASAAMGMEDEAVGVHVTGINAETCRSMQDEIFLCEVGVRIDGNMGNNPYARAGIALYSSGQPRPIAFTRASGDWTVDQLYTECTYTEEGASCTYFE